MTMALSLFHKLPSGEVTTASLAALTDLVQLPIAFVIKAVLSLMSLD